MSAVRVPVLTCDGHTRTGLCGRQYIGQAGLTFAELRRLAEGSGWSRTPSLRGDYCPGHKYVPVTRWSADGRRQVTS